VEDTFFGEVYDRLPNVTLERISSEFAEEVWGESRHSFGVHMHVDWNPLQGLEFETDPCDAGFQGPEDPELVDWLTLRMEQAAALVADELEDEGKLPLAGAVRQAFSVSY